MTRTHLMSIGVVPAGAIALILHAAPPATKDAIADDVLMKALIDELGRSMTLQLDETKSPYFVQYAVNERTQRRLVASCGSITTSDEDKARWLATTVRVGYYDLDNSNFTGGSGAAGLGGRRGGGSVPSLVSTARLPLDDQYPAIRQTAWLSTDGAYKNAVETLARKQAFIEGQHPEPRPNDLARAESLVKVAAKVDLKLDLAEWERRLRTVSAQFLQHAHVVDSQVSLSAVAENDYLINSEGTRLRQGQVMLTLGMSARAQAADGAPLAEGVTRYASTADALPTEQELLALANEMASRLSGRSSAAKLDHYIGPVLFEDEASPELFEAMLGGIVGQPEPVGGGRRRFNGVEDLDRYLGKRILPEDFQVFDDPRIEQFAGEFLPGHYQVDDEGVLAQRVDVVVNGRLEGILMSRAPTAKFEQSNGHGRGGGSGRASATVGCLFVQSSNPVPSEQLRTMLMDAVREQKLEFGVRIAKVASGLRTRADAALLRATGGPRGPGRPGSTGIGGAVGGSTVGDPIAIFKVYPDGREERVRGCEFGSIDVATLRTILAAGDEPVVFNFTSFQGPIASIIAPPVLFEEVELFAVQDEPRRLPIVPSPLRRMKE